MPRVLGYARVSSEEQARGTSLQDQQASIASYAKARGLKVHHCYVEAESGIRAKAEKRVQMAALLADVRRGDLVLCDKLDRWSRDAEFSYSSIRQILERGAHFYAIADRLDPSTSEGDTALGFRILFAREEHKRIKERMVGTRNLLRDQGYYMEGEPPMGYRRPHPKGYRGVEKNVLVIVESEAAVVRRIFRMAIGGRSMREIASEFGFNDDRVKDTLDRRLYIGEIRSSKGEWIAGKHPAIISGTTFVAARAAVDSRRLGGVRVPGRPTRTAGWMLRDVAMCGHCGARMSSSYGATRNYYRCSHACTSAYVPVLVVESQASGMILARLQALRAELAVMPRAIPKADPAVRLAKLAETRKRLTDGYAEGLIAPVDFRSRIARLDDEHLMLTSRAIEIDPAARREMLREVQIMEQAWLHMSGEQRRATVNDLVLRAALVAGKEPDLTWRATEDLSAEE